MSEPLVLKTFSTDSQEYQQLVSLLSYFSPVSVEWKSDPGHALGTDDTHIYTIFPPTIVTTDFSTDHIDAENSYVETIIQLETSSPTYEQICQLPSNTCPRAGQFQAQIQWQWKPSTKPPHHSPTIIAISTKPWEASSLYFFDVDGDGDKDWLLAPVDSSPITVLLNTFKTATRPLREVPQSLWPEETFLYQSVAHVIDEGTADKSTFFGSTFLIQTSPSHSYFLTAWHVCDHTMQKPHILFYGAKPIPFEVVAKDPALDIALLRVRTKDLQSFLRLKPASLPLAPSTVEEGEPLTIYGFDAFRVLMLKRYIGLVEKKSDSPDTTIDLRLAGGMSGGPVLNHGNKVVGVHKASDIRDNAAYLVGLPAIRTFLKQHLPTE